MRLKILLLVLLFSSLIFPCNGSASILVPAVVGDGSNLVNISVRLIPGQADVFLSAYPQTGISTQESVDDAALYAFSKAKVDDCDAIILIDTSGSAGYVDGPSGGAAISVLTYSALMGAPIRSDAVMTGSVDILGNVGAVGGVYEKAMAAVANKADYFIVPEADFLDLILLREVEKKYDIEIFEINDVDEAIGFMLYNKSLSPLGFDQPEEDYPDLVAYDTGGMPGFIEVGRKMIALNNRTIEDMPVNDNDSITIKDHFRSQVLYQETLLDKGYLFTAANEAFLDYIEGSTISAVLNDKLDLSGKRRDAGKCLSELPSVDKTDQNYEWVVGSDLRRAWAAGRIASTNISDAVLVEEKVLAYNELMYADGWCFVSGALADAANESGTRIDEGSWKNLSKEMIDEAGRMNITSQSDREKLESAEYSYSQGKYGAALFDATYAITMENADLDLIGMNESALESEVESLLREKRTSLWGNVYQSQGAFLANTSSSASAYRILLYAKALDETTERMESNVVAKGGVIDISSPETEILLFSIFLIITMLLFYVAIRLGRRSNGKRNNAARYRKFP